MFGIVEKEGNKFKFQAGVNCYSTLEELPLEFVTAYKMWKIGTENEPKLFDFKNDRRGNRDASMFHHPLHECMRYAMTPTTKTLVCSLHTATCPTWTVLNIS
jgi:hypothetical protein